MLPSEAPHVHSDRQPENEAEQPKPRILIVDDSRTMRQAAHRLLGRDFDVLDAGDADTAWELISSDQGLQVVFADLMMPEKNGFQLLRQIRESTHQRISQLPVIIMTGHDDSEKMKRQAMLLGATDFISKPFDSVQLKTRAQTHAQYEQTTRQLQEARSRLAKGGTLDTLTGLANQRYFREHGPELLASAARQNNDMAVLRLDIDEFNELFRRRGKTVADKVLLNISKIIGACVREEDGVARVGLAKFAVIMPGADENAARGVAERIHKRIQAAVYRLGASRFHMTASAALVMKAGETMEFDEVVKQAEQRLERAIQRGGNRLVLSDTDDDEAGVRGSDQTGGGDAIQTQQEQIQAASEPPVLTLDEALLLVQSGETERLREQLKPLASKLYPLLEFCDQQWRLGLNSALSELQKHLKE